jgi:hypothetical protein
LATSVIKIRYCWATAVVVAERRVLGTIVRLNGVFQMKMKHRNGILFLTSLMMATMVGWALLRSTSFFNLLNSDVRRSLEWPIFTIGVTSGSFYSRAELGRQEGVASRAWDAEQRSSDIRTQAV